MTPGDVEKRLKEIFRYAQLWNCVLLLDECDIFLTQRTKTDIVRNSLVSSKPAISCRLEYDFLEPKRAD
jgi:SpoVK/Ycf46/Vps4 family AAA+-type ATPase